jgi:uncharacterized protein
MTTKINKTTENIEISVEDKLKALFELQTVDSEIDKIKILRGELPLEVRDLEDEVAGLETRMQNIQEDLSHLTAEVLKKKNEIKESETQIKKYETQQQKVRNNREYDSLTKEVEFQNLEIQLSEKRIKEYQVLLNEKKLIIDESKKILDEKKEDLDTKRAELDSIIADTRKDEENLIKKSKSFEKIIEARLLTAYKRIRENARNGLAVVTVARDACGGCFNKIPPQRQLDVASRKKIIVCEYCGRILVDEGISALINPS